MTCYFTVTIHELRTKIIYFSYIKIVYIIKGKVANPHICEARAMQRFGIKFTEMMEIVANPLSVHRPTI